MIQGGEMSMQDYVAIVKRRWPVLVVLAFLGCLIAFGVARVLPKKFTSQTTVLVDPSRVSKEVVPELVNEDINHKLGSMKQQIMSRSRLEPIIDNMVCLRMNRKTSQRTNRLRNCARRSMYRRCHQPQEQTTGDFLVFTSA